MNWFKEKENIFLIVGFIAAIGAIITPFCILWGTSYSLSKSTFNNIGVIGDFFGGTTSGLLTLASFLLIISTMVMQKKELESTRKEFSITNSTMKKQSFDSTFFQMVNLHHSILKDIIIKDEDSEKIYVGRYAIERLKEIFISKVEDFKKLKIEELKINLARNEEIFREIYEDNFKMEYVKSIHNENKYLRDMNSEEIIRQFKEDYTESFKEQLDNYYEYLDIDNKEEYMLNKIDIENLIAFNHIKYTSKYEEVGNGYRECTSRPNNLYKREVYEKFYKDNVELIGHYYRNLYRIVKIINETDFSDENDDWDYRMEINYREKKNYRGILRAQLSTTELWMLFYNINFSEKGEKFNDLLRNTNFFDNHMQETNLIWGNDRQLLKQYK